MTVTFSIDKKELELIKRAAKENHRSVSKQIAFFCAQGLSKVNDDNQALCNAQKGDAQ